MADKALQLLDVHAFYGKSHVVQGVNLEVPHGGVVALLGRNGAGKTTTLRAILNLIPSKRGRVIFAGTDVSRWSTDAIARLGISYVPQEAKIFPGLTVLENLKIATSTTPRPRSLDEVLDEMPLLRDFLARPAGTLSGGQQQMVAIARSLVMNCRVLLMDEPTDGLMPKLVHEVSEMIRLLGAKGISVLLVEQNLELALAVSQRVYIMEKGQIRHQGESDALRGNEPLLRKYLGVGAA